MLTFVDVDGLIASNGVGVVCTDIDDMTAHAKRMLDDDDGRREAGDRAVRLVEERFDAEVTARAHLTHFESILRRDH